LSLLDHGPGQRASAAGVYSETYYPRIHFGWSHLRSLTDDRHHYIDGPKPELYEIVRDPRETEDRVLADASVARSMKKELAAYPAGLVAPSHVDPDQAERLKALGYLSSVTPTGDDEVLPNPRDRIHVHEELKAAFSLALQGKHEEALTAIRRLLEANPECFEAHRDLAATLARLGRYAEAATAYKEAIRVSPRLAGSVALPLGLVELELGNLGEAERQARLLMGDAATESEGAVILAQVLVRRSELPQALKVLEEAQRGAIEQGRSPAAELGPLRADVLARLGRFAEAEVVLREQLQSVPGRAQTYASLAVVVAIQGRSRVEVREILDAMLKVKPGRETILLGAKTLDFLGDKDAAREWQRRAAQSRRSTP
jgi:tetratricopeptide (TPR) repeat protein